MYRNALERASARSSTSVCPAIGVHRRRRKNALTAVAALTGLLLSTGAAEAQAETILQAEAMTRSGSSVISDSNASGDKAVRFGGNSSVSKTLTTDKNTIVRLRTRGEQCKGAPRATVKIDGKVVMDPEVTATSYVAAEAWAPVAAGSHKVEVLYANNFIDSVCNRNLVLDKVTFTTTSLTGVTAPPPTTTTPPPTTTTPPPTTTTPPPTTTTPTPTPEPGSDPVIAAAGDIACPPGASVTSGACRQKATSDLLVGQGLAKVLQLGDEQYDSGSLSAFRQSYDPTWGRVKSISAPVPGNHEYNTSGAAGYYDYFGALAGPRGKGFYSYDVGAWHLIALNSNISRGSTSEQVTWLKNDLAANAGKKCVLAYWHHPRFTAARYGPDTSVQPFWQALYDANADVVLASHDHNYQRFAPLNAAGARDGVRGIRSFVVGTGGKSRYAINSSSLREAASGDTFGVLKLTLRAESYEWKLQPEAGRTYTDTGTGTCH